jgi:glycosyltransferase involved in cell wall biosynthesis
MDRSAAETRIPHTRILRPLRWWNPIGWILAGLTLRGDVVHAQWWSAPLAPVYVALLLLARLRGKRVLVTVHNVEPHERGLPAKFANRAILPLAHHVIVHSEQNARTLVTRGFDATRISVVPIGIGEPVAPDPDRRVAARAQLGLTDEAPLVLFHGNIRPYKGLDVLLEAFALVRTDLPDARLAVVGQPWSGAHDPCARITELGLADCTHAVLEYVSADEMECWIDASDVAVYPYTHFDAQSAAACDAVRRSSAIIVSDVGGLPSLVRDARVVIQPGDARTLSRVLYDVLSDAPFRSALEAGSLETARRLTWETVANQTVEIYGALRGAPAMPTSTMSSAAGGRQ